MKIGFYVKRRCGVTEAPHRQCPGQGDDCVHKAPFPFERMGQSAPGTWGDL